MREKICPRCNGAGVIYKKKKGKEPLPVDQRFWSKVDKKGIDDCWEWKAYINPAGYGQFSNYRDNKNVTAHRVSFELTTGDVLSDLDFVCHKCNNKRCVNPNHLYKGDALSNMQDTIASGNWHRPPNTKGFESPNVNITKDIALEIRSKWEDGRSAKSLAKEYKIGRTTVGRIVNKQGIYADI